MKVIDLFAGGGGLSEGFRQAGFEIVAHVEMDKSACNTLKTREAFYYLKRTNNLNNYLRYLKKEITRDELYYMVPKDIMSRVIQAEITIETLPSLRKKIDSILASYDNPKVDLIIGGPPCQAYSTAGKSRDPYNMENDKRNYLYFRYIDFLKYYRPKMFIFENVKGILTSLNGSVFESLKKHLSLAGYNLDYKILNAKDFGVSQSRERVILIGWQKRLNLSYPTFPNVVPSTIKELFNDLPPLQSGESIDGEYAYLKNENISNNFIRPENWRILTQHITRKNNENDLKIYNLAVNTWLCEKRFLKYNELPKDLQTHKNTKSFLDRYKPLKYDDISHTVVAHISKDGHYYIHPDLNQNRSISVREAARLQSFPDDYYFEDSRTAAFKQIGNAVPPLMAFKIANVLFHLLDNN
ncbi:DNA cytosine methyltransferase [Lysinibacillus capsici]|uniref:DNA cytosine methyltransferase n=1 Tax=Lysinibacillus capsici TaxID=2115968 RepID=UPI0027A2832E|nr:DNA cytosine methyltransferase [Lysinibacillus boronitolerans]